MRIARSKAGAVLLVGIIQAACGDSGGASLGTPPPTTTMPDIAVSQVFTSMPAFANPVAMAQAPGDTARWFVAEKSGALYAFANNPSSSSASVFLDLRGFVNDSNEGGLLSFAFHPQFPATPEVFVAFTRGSPMVSYVSKFTSTNGGDTLNFGTEEIILEIAEPSTNHNIGTVAFGPGGLLFVGFGDGGSGAAANGQDDMNIHGSIVRVDVDGGMPYAIPPDNRNAGNGVCVQGFGGAPCGEIYAWGFRNPWRFTFDSQTGNLWAGDVGQVTWEEIDRVELGENYGWDVREGANCYNPASGCATTFTDPITEYGRSLGSSVTGGYVYRGSAISDLIGWYIFGDFASGRIFGIRANSATGVTAEELLGTGNSIVSFAQDNDGELYFLDFSVGTIHKIEDAP